MKQNPKISGLILIAALSMALGGGVYEKTSEGNQLWLKGKYQEAFAKYTEAISQAKGPAETRLHYNLADSLYKQQQYQEAIKEFEPALASPDQKLKEKTYYNLGNCYFRMGIAQKSLDLLKKAAENYQKALEIDPNDQDAKHNLEVVRRHIKLQSQQQPPQPNPQQQQQGQEQKKDQQAQNQQKQQEQKMAEPNKKGGEQKPQGGGPQPKQLSKEDAERILKSLSEQEKEELKNRMQVQSINQPSGKDW